MSAPPLLRNPTSNISPSPRIKPLSLSIPVSPRPALAAVSSSTLTSSISDSNSNLLQPPVPFVSSSILSSTPDEPPPISLLTPRTAASSGNHHSIPDLHLSTLSSPTPTGTSAATPSLRINTLANEYDQHEDISMVDVDQSPFPMPTANHAIAAQFTAASETRVTFSEPLKYDATYPDVEDLDEEGWEHAASNGRIIEIARLGEGTSGSVTKCQLVYGRTTFALKTIPANPNPEIRKQVLRELLFNKSCNSPHIVRYYGRFVNEHNASISIAMEYCAGRSLEAIYKHVKSRGGRIGEKVLGHIAYGVLSGLSYLHERKIIHRDIKPQNILLDGQGQVKLCDFGVSGEVVNSLATTFTGTSYYMAPERIQGHPYSVTSDVWSLGLTLLEVAQHRFPFPPEGEPPLMPIEILSYIVDMEPPRLHDEPHNNIKWSESFRHFIACCLEKDAKKRASPRQMLNHPWIKGITRKPIPMDRFVQECWAE
ncbi:kinase-like domain-containing protein [Lipomyces oligophaga]|uniref:kinase-like domain-containing protein n=1 Tax=Lipomyces oligophaga TaxID=45792 RepID=UPI0034CF4743